MSLTFGSTGVLTNTYSEIFDVLVAGYKAIYGNDIDTDQDSPDGSRIGIETTLRFDVESAFSWLYSQLDPDLNNGDMQQVIGKLAGVYMLASSRSQWDLSVEMDRAKDLPSGYTITDNNNQDWFLDSAVTVAIGSNEITFLSSDWGDISGSYLSSSFTQSTPELGVLSISASADATQGREEETEEEFRVRRKSSVENPSQSTNGAIYAKLAQLSGVTDLQVYDNSTSVYDSDKDLDAHFMWVVIEGGSLDDIGEVIAKQRLGGTKGETMVSYTDELTKPNGDAFYIVNEHKIDRPDYVDLYIKLTATQKVSGSEIDTDAIKEQLVLYTTEIGVSIAADELYEQAKIDNYNYILSDIEVSLDGVTWTNQQVSPDYIGKFTIDEANITITEVTI